jgi:ribosomal protein S3
VNPIAVRLGFNRSPDSSWFSDYYYATLLYQDLNLKDYLNSIRPPTGNQLGFRTGRCTIHHYPKRSLIHLFCLTGATSALSSLLPLVASGQKMGGPKPMVHSKRGERSDARVIRFAPLAAFDSVLLDAPQPPVYKARSGSAQKLQPVIAKRTAGVTNLSSFAKHRFLQYLQKKAQNISIDCLEINPFNTAAPPKGNTNLNLVQKKGHVGSSEIFKTRSVGPLHEINPLLSLNHWKQIILNRVQTVKPMKDELISTAPQYNTSSVSLINTCLNYYVMQYFFRFKLNFVNNERGFGFARRTSWIVLRDLLLAPLPPGEARSETRAFVARRAGSVVEASAAHLLHSSSLRGIKRTRALSNGAMLRTSGTLLWLQKGPSGPQPLGQSLREAQGRDTRLKDNLLVRSPILRYRPISRVHHYLWSNLQTTLSSSTNTLTSIMPIKVNSVYRSAFLLAQEIACKLEQKKSFRLISRAIFQHIEVCNYIKGIRISCSGRLNGAEIAKTECKKYGETSLHVFSDRIDYAYTKAFTPYGILGVKVWISYL